MKTVIPQRKNRAKEYLSKLVASENLYVYYSNTAKTASFDVKSRVLRLPNWNVPDEVFDMFVVHECGHAIDTPRDFVKDLDAIVDRVGEYSELSEGELRHIVHDYLNIVEDIRIEKNQKKRYPGSLKDFAAAYKYLYENNFFGIHVKSLSFIDRVNVYFKVGIATSNYNIVPFSKDELVWIDKLKTISSFQDVLTYTEDLLMQVIDGLKKPTFNDSDSIFDIDVDVEILIPVQVDTEDIVDQVIEEETNKSKSFVDTTGLDITENSEEDNELMPSATEKQFTEQQQATLSKNGQDLNLVIIPSSDNISLNDIMIHWRKAYMSNKEKNADIFDYLEKKRTYKTSYKDLLRKLKPLVNHMIMEFERKKAADEYAAMTVSKRGELSTERLYDYRTSDDLFLRKEIAPEGKNHGIVFVIDWSSSMYNVTDSVKQQTIALIQFCRQMHIPFEVYVFSNNDKQNGYLTPHQMEHVHTGSFILYNLFSSEMSDQQLNLTLKGWYENILSKKYCGPDGGTPLVVSAVFGMSKIVEVFKNKNNVQFCNVVYLTDGGDTDWIEYVTTQYIDSVTKKSYNSPQELMRIVADRNQCKMYNFFITHVNSSQQKFNKPYTIDHNVGPWTREYRMDVSMFYYFNQINSNKTDTIDKFMDAQAKKKDMLFILSEFIGMISS